MAINTSNRSTQVKEHLLDWIDNNQYGQGDQLPSEAEMARALGVSRSTVREAYIMLEAEGIIVRKHGSGTFVSRSSKIRESLLDDLIGFPNRIKLAGYSYDYKLISINHVIPDPETRRILDIAPENSCLQVKYIQYADGKPALYLVDHFATWIDYSKFDWDQFEGHMLEFVSDALDLPERHFHSRVLATVTDKEVSGHLSLPEGTPVVNVRSTVTSLDGKPTTYSVTYFNPENVEFELSRVYRHR